MRSINFYNQNQKEFVEREILKFQLTVRSSAGKSYPSLIPRFIWMNRSTVGLSLTLGLCKLVFSMIMAKEST